MTALDAVLPARVHQRLGAQNIRAQEQPRILHRAIHVALRREVHQNIGMLLLKELLHRRPVGNIGLDEAEVFMLHGLVQRRHVARIGQAVQTDNAVLRMILQLKINEIAADKAGAAGHDDRHACSSS